MQVFLDFYKYKLQNVTNQNILLRRSYTILPGQVRSCMQLEQNYSETR